MNRSRSLVDALVYHSDRDPRSLLLHDLENGFRLTYAEAADMAAGFASLLTKRGLVPGDRVGLVLENRWEWVAAFLGCLWMGAVPVPLNTRWRLTEVAAALSDSASTLVLTEAAHRDAIPATFAGRVVDVDAAGWPSGRASPSPARGEALGLITYTSGTTGAPKGVMLSQEALFLSSACYAALFNSGSDLVTAIAVPLFHNTGFIDGLGHALVAGGQIDLYRRFDAARIAGGLVAGDYSFFIGVPTMYARMAAALEVTKPSLSDPWLAYGGGPMPNAIPARFGNALPAVRWVNCYGLSEATSITHYLPWRLAQGRWDAAGIPVPGTWDRISDSGELWINTPTAMLGYWRRESDTAAKFVDGWLRTGDFAARDPDGILRVLGRMDEMINRGGEKIAPFEVESALCDLPEVREAAVVGLPDPDLGQVPGALVVMRGEPNVDLRIIRHQLSERLADFKLPVLIRSTDSLPRNANGKVLRAEVVARLLE